MADFKIDDISAHQQTVPVQPKNIGRHRRWILPAAAGAALLALAAAMPQFVAEVDAPLPTAAAVRVPDAPAVEAALPVHRVTTVRIEPREERLALAAAANNATAERDEAPGAVNLGQGDPRWAREVTQPNPRQLPWKKAGTAEFEKPSSVVALAGARSISTVEDAGPALSRVKDDAPIVPLDEPLDPMQTASLPEPSAADMEVAAIDPEPEAVDEPEPRETAARTTSRATTHVNMRAGPGDEHKVLTVVPADAVVEVIGCDSWCEISYEGRTGFVFNRFVNASGAKAAPKPARTKKAASVKQASNNVGTEKTAVGKLPEALTPDSVEASAAEPAAGQHNAFGFTCGFSRQCATYGPSTGPAPTAN